MRALLAGTSEGAALLAHDHAVTAVCFVEDTLSVVTGEHVIRLHDGLSDAEAAARLGHLLVHERDGHPMGDPIAPGADCPALVHHALELEATAYATETRLRRALAVTSPVMAFELDAETDVPWLAYLEAHPNGAPGIDALGAGYLAQCERAN